MKILKIVAVSGLALSSLNIQVVSAKTYNHTVNSNFFDREVACMSRLGIKRVSESAYDRARNTMFIYYMHNHEHNIVYAHANHDKIWSCAGA